MKLSIIALDGSWQFVKRIAEATKQWEDIEIVNKSNLAIADSIFYDNFKSCDNKVVIAAFDPKVRQTEYEIQKQNHAEFATLIHPNNYIDKSTVINEGCIIGNGVIVYPDSVLSANVLIAEYASVSHDVVVTEHSVIETKVTIAGGCKIGANSHIKANAVLKEQITIGDRCVVEAGSAVVSDVADELTVAGNPARIKRNITI